MPASLDLIAARNVPFVQPINIYYSGGDLPIAGASIKMQVRLYAGQPGAAIAEAATVEYSNSFARGGDTPLRVLQVVPTIPKETLSAMPSGLVHPEPGEADRYVYDLVITYFDGVKETLAEGFFFLKPGVTIS